jgi:acyl-CoA synthetase (AMP-forming)/AMP-acid ligase II
VPNSRSAIAASYAIALTGAAEAAINPALSVDDANHCLSLAGAKRVLATLDHRKITDKLNVELMRVEDVAPVRFASLPDRPVDEGDWGRLMFTSGTTGAPKGIVHSHRGRWTSNLLLRATLPVTPEPGRVVLLMTPYAHGTSMMTQAFLDTGGAVRLVDGVQEEIVRHAIETGDVDQISAPPTVLARLVSLFDGRRIESIRAIFCGTSPLSRELYLGAREIFGPVVRITYGKTEIVNPITVLTPAESDRWYVAEDPAGSICVGWPASGVEVRIDEDGSGNGDGAAEGPQVGPILLRARHQLVATLTEHGVEPQPPDEFHHTGDLGFVDADGRLHLTGREADVIKTGGYRVTPEEVEYKLRPGLAAGELVVLGLPSSHWGEVIVAVAAGAPADWVQALGPQIEALTGYKRPRLFAEVPAIERNALGKIVRRRVRESVLDAYELVDGRYPRLERRASRMSDVHPGAGGSA